MWNDLFSCSCRVCAKEKLDPPRSFSQAHCFSQYKSTREETLVRRQTRGWPDALLLRMRNYRIDVSSIGRASYCDLGVSIIFSWTKPCLSKDFCLLSVLKFYSNSLSRLFNPCLSASLYWVFFFFYCCRCFLPRLYFFRKTTILANWKTMISNLRNPGRKDHETNKLTLWNVIFQFFSILDITTPGCRDNTAKINWLCFLAQVTCRENSTDTSDPFTLLNGFPLLRFF